MLQTADSDILMNKNLKIIEKPAKNVQNTEPLEIKDSDRIFESQIKEECCSRVDDIEHELNNSDFNSESGVEEEIKDNWRLDPV